MNIKDIYVNPNNPRYIKDERYQKLKKSIKEFPKMMKLRPIVIDDKGMILGGNMRYLAMIDLGYKDIPEGWVVKANELTEEEKKRFIIADNVELGAFDYDILANEWDLEKLQDWGIELPELEDIIEINERDDEIPEPPKESKSKLGDLYQLGNHKLLCGDATKEEDVEKLMNGKKADMVFTDPPYGLEYEAETPQLKKFGQLKSDTKNYEVFRNFIHKFMFNIFNNLKIKSAFYIFMGDKMMEAILEYLRKKVEMKAIRVLIWDRVMPRLCNYPQDYIPKHELFIFGFYKKRIRPKNRLGKGEFQSTIWAIKTMRACEFTHPTEKPVELSVNAILNDSDKNNIILDLFGGSGSTLIACEKLNRICYMMEIDPIYIDVIIERWENYTGKKVVKING